MFRLGSPTHEFVAMRSHVSARVADSPPSRRRYDSSAIRRNSVEHRTGMYITDARHFLDDKGAIGPLRGPAKAMADFHASVIAYATIFDDSGRVTVPRCFKCKKGTVEAALAQDDAIVWHCPRCQAEGRISNWQATLWDLSERPDAAN